MTGIVVVDQRADWPVQVPGIEVMTAWEYLTHDIPPPANGAPRARRRRVYNLCRSFEYQSTGYYVSLLAGARDHRPLPDITTIQDLKLAESPRVLNDEIEELIQHALSRISSGEYAMHVYFGHSPVQRHERLARALFNLFPAPLLEVDFSRRAGEWRVDALGPVALGKVPEVQREFMLQAARDYFARSPTPRRKRETARYDLAILVNDDEKEPPSNARALKQFEKAAEDLGFEVEFLDKSDYGHVAEFDALFIRETTAVNHHTYRFARRAAREGLVVVDDPLSILRCGNKVFLAQLLDRHRIPQPKTLVLHPKNITAAGRELGFPCVLKQPDSQFSKGVIKVENETDLKSATRGMLERSDLIVAQAFEPTEYDWRVGVLDGQALYACRYYMAPQHWQVVRRGERGGKYEGEHETLDVADVPPHVLKVAVDAARAIGSGLYGVDLKQFGDRCKVIEVNDNPNLDFGVEDLVLKEALYRRVMEYFLRRLESRTREQGR
jgi:glutathione synthase/RimK-type ligase-like ATP-grasp enzyme